MVFVQHKSSLLRFNFYKQEDLYQLLFTPYRPREAKVASVVVFIRRLRDGGDRYKEIALRNRRSEGGECGME